MKDLAAPRSTVLYEVVRHQGEEELGRPAGSLFWSGTAGGVTIMASVIAEGVLRHKLPVEIPWREIVSDLGYSLGVQRKRSSACAVVGCLAQQTARTLASATPTPAGRLGMNAS